MSEIPSNEVLNEKLSNLIKMTEEGFRSTHLRQDITNGKVIKSEDRLVKTEAFQLKMETSLGIFKWLFGVLGLGNIVLIAKAILDAVK